MWLHYIHFTLNIVFFFQDIIENEDIKLDQMFISSLVHDLIKVSKHFSIINSRCQPLGGLAGFTHH